jgi:flagellar basal body rod protein FlgF
LVAAKGRAAEIAPTHRNATLMRRMEDSNFRQVARVTSLLIRMKRHELQMKALENTAVLQDVLETKRVSDG